VAETTQRIEAFSDGVFAIAITLLVLEIKVPHADGPEALWHALAGLWPSYVAFLLSFFVILIMWINHHELMRMVRAASYPFLFANGFLLLTVTFVPFPTAVLAEHLPDPDSRTPAAVFYGGTLVVTAISFNVLWWAARGRRRLIGADAHPEGVRTITFRYGMGPLSYGMATAVALVNVWASLAIHLGLALMYALSERREDGEEE